jgi:hypothetical protein
MSEFGYITARGTNYNGRIQKIGKGDERIRPIYEAFSNAFEARKNLPQDKITICINLKKNLFSNETENFEFVDITIEDNGIGFEEKEFARFITLDDTSKGIGNKGSGRVQFIKFFEKAEIKSVYVDTSSPTGYKKRKFTLSNNKAFVLQNAIVYLDLEEETSENETGTILKLLNPIEINTKEQTERIYYKTVTVEELKKLLKEKFIALLCENRDNLPDIMIQRTINGNAETSTKISFSDIPTIDKSENLNINYTKINIDGKVEKSTNTEILNLKSFKISQNELERNAIKLVSKGEIAGEIKLDCIASTDSVNDIRYLFLLSGNLIDNTDTDTDTRGRLYIPTENNFKKSYGDPNTLFPEEVITIDEIRETIHEKINTIYPEIVEHSKQKQVELEALKDMFLLDSETIKKAKIKPTDDEETALKKIYGADSEFVAKKDIEIKKRH